ncbi:hypothetical protein HK100_001995 [Physocladia obscura]|uniref:Uncharacterized protein n=1 Tax=Physocladia obscura TaxID=109957 RepID=A0AAD5SW12_9FUNG|nr:hypothetical protein HK100_001995 [Physocladia obscura]
MQHQHQQPQTSTKQKLKYIPTAQEKAIVARANGQFAVTYVSGIAAGLALGVALSRHPPAFFASPMRRLSPGWTIFAVSVTGEYIGRRIGKSRANLILENELPKDSVLRHLLAPSPSSPSSPVDYSLEGSIPADRPEKESARVEREQADRERATREREHTEREERVSTLEQAQRERAIRERSSSSLPKASSNQTPFIINQSNNQSSSSPSSSWNRIRSIHNPQPSSAWDRIRHPSSAKPSQANNNTARQNEIANHNNNDDLFYNDNDNFDNEYKTTTPEPSSSTSMLPRTREDAQEAVRTGKLVRNKYGDYKKKMSGSVQVSFKGKKLDIAIDTTVDTLGDLVQRCSDETGVAPDRIKLLASGGNIILSSFF